MHFFLCMWQSPDGVLRMRKLQKQVLKALQESGVVDDKSRLSEMLEHKVRLIFCLNLSLAVYVFLSVFF